MPYFTDLMPKRASQARDKSFNDELSELRICSAYAEQMYRAGKLSMSEYDDWKGQTMTKYIEALPLDDFHEMMKDGRLTELQTYAGHDGTRDAGDVDDARAAVVRKIEASALDEAWLDRRISSEQYADYGRRVVGDRHANDLIEDADGDHEKVAAEMFASRNDDSPLQSDLQSYMDKTYGNDRPNREPAGRVVPNENKPQPSKVIDVSKMSAAEALQVRLDETPKRPKESASRAPIKDRIIDHDAPEEEAA